MATSADLPTATVATASATLSSTAAAGPHPGTPPRSQARHFFRHLLLGLRFCHGLGIFHRDLKLENLMLATDPSAPPTAAGWERRVVKIADFGLSDLTPVGLSTTYCGSPLYAAPELMSGGSREGYDASRSGERLPPAALLPCSACCPAASATLLPSPSPAP